MSNSKLATYTAISPNRTSPRNHKIDTITIHCMAAQWTASQCANYFEKSSVQASSNYCVGHDGSIALSVPEADRSWASSNRENDHRAITIEVASDSKAPYAVTEKAYKALIELLVDVCKRNGIEKLVWSEKKENRINHKGNANMTVHMDFANKACPGEWLYSRMGQIAKEVNNILNEEEIIHMDITRAELIKLIDERIQAAINNTDTKPGSWALKEWANAKRLGITDGSRPKAMCTRQETAVMILRAIGKDGGIVL